MDAYPLFVNRQISQAGIDPAARIEVVNSVLLDVDGVVRVPAENTVSVMLPRILQSSCGNLRRHAQPARVQPVNQPRNGISLEVEFLELKIERRAQGVEPYVAYLKTIELMTMDRNVPQSAVLPGITLVNAHAHKMRHDVGKAVIVIAFHPHNFNIALGIR